MRRSWLLPAALWSTLTVLGEAALTMFSLLPEGYAEEAEVSDEAFMMLLRLAVPVFFLVITVLVVSVARHAVKDSPPEDARPVQGNRGVEYLWLAVTSALAVMLIVNPGLVGLAEIEGDPVADRVIEVEGSRWFWRVGYPEAEVQVTDEIVLPVDERIRFDITSTDVLHSFWIPAFRLKLDAVPGRTTRIYASPDRTGSYDTDPNMRLQCAEMCGTGHAVMRLPIRVLEKGEFESWLRSKIAGNTTDASGTQGSTPTSTPTEGSATP